VYFERGTRRPHPAGRAFLALIACALDRLSARRFAEYLSLGQVPETSSGGTIAAFPTSSDEVFGALGERAEQQAATSPDEETIDTTRPDTPARRAFRAPWKWERLLANRVSWPVRIGGNAA
jgi:hypothetical protein